MFSRRTVAIALALHAGTFLLFFVCAVIRGLFVEKEVITPIDLTVIVNENLEGKENEPPPLKNPTPPEPPKPKPKPKPKPAEVKKPDPPKPLEQIVTNIVIKKEAKKEDKKEEKKEKKAEEKKPEAPKKTKAELRKERLERMRKSATVSNKPVKIEVKDAQRSGDGRTERQNLSEAEIRKFLNQGYKAGTSNQLAASEKQRCLSLVQMAISDMWDRLQPKVGNAGYVFLSVQFNSSGGLVNVRLSKGCGDKLSDEAALSVARRVTSIRGLSPDFIAQFRKETLTIRYKVEAR